MSKIISCKICGAEIAKSAKTCPHCGAKLKKGHPVLIGVLIFFIFIALITPSSDEEPQKVDSPAQTQNSAHQNLPINGESETDDKIVFYVGETAELNGVTVSLVQITVSTGSYFNLPTEGNVFVLCEFEIVNNSNKEISISSVMSFEAYCDEYACNYSLGALMEKGSKNQLDGTVAPGKKFNGVVGYELPADWKELEIIFTPDFWSGKDITFIATNN